MSRIFITGDIHGEFGISRLNSTNFSEGNTLTKDDYVIICGDFGFIFNYKGMDKEEKYWLDWLDSKPWTTLFIDGNHECFPRLRAYNVEEWNGGKVHRINRSILHLMRGEIFTLNGKIFFCYGGAASHDKAYRIRGKDWWPEEEPSLDEYNNAMRNLREINFQPNYIITHAMPDMYLKEFYGYRYSKGTETGYQLNDILLNCSNYTKWYCGHYHCDVQMRPDFQICYQHIYEI